MSKQQAETVQGVRMPVAQNPGDSIVVGTDGSETASAAVMRAGALARSLRANVHLVCAFSTIAVRAGRTPDGQAYEQAHNDALTILEEGARRLRASGVGVQNHAIYGDAAEALLQTAEAHRARMIVVGSKGMSGARRYLLGSVPNKVSHHATCNVLIVRTA